MHLDIPGFLGLLAVLLALARLLGFLAQKIGQPAVLGELLAGVLAGASVLGLIDPNDPKRPETEVLHLLAEVGVVILLFEIGLETDLKKLLQVGGASAVVAVVGVILPFALGAAVCWLFGVGTREAIVIGASLTATSVGITARVLSDLGRLQEPESRIILGAAVLDDVLGLIILAVVSGLQPGHEVSFLEVARITGIAFGFLAATLLLGRLVVPPLVRLAGRVERPGTLPVVGLLLAFGLAWLAAQAGSAVIIGAFAAGLLLSGLPQAPEIERGINHLGHFFVPLFFLAVGAMVDLRTLNPLDPAGREVLLLGGLLIVVAVVGKVLAGYAPFWFRGKKSVIGVGMVPRGEVGLIFAQKGLESRVFGRDIYSAIALMVMATTFLTPPLLKLLFPPPPPKPPPRPDGVGELVTEP